MDFFPQPFNKRNYYRIEQMQKTYKSLDEALDLIKEAVEDERKDELFYEYLISIAPKGEEKGIIASIRDDEKKHGKYFREIFAFYTKESIPLSTTVDFEKTQSFTESIVMAKFGELAAVEKYRDIRAGLSDPYYRDMLFEIITDELKHAQKYDYILYLILKSKLDDRSDTKAKENILPKYNFTLEEAEVIARSIGIDFSKVMFDPEEFRVGLNVELEHGKRDPLTNVTNDNPILTGKIALAHLNEFPDYYKRLTKLEEEAKQYWSNKQD